jgi:mono/diheme cytochrome c family protein
VLRYSGHQIKNQPELLMRAAQDDEGRVRLEALVAASWLDKEVGLPIVEEAGKHPMDKWMVDAYATAIAHLNGMSLKEKKDEEVQTHLTGKDRELFIIGKAIYARDGFCSTCHQPDGGGLSASGFPPLVGTPWVLGNEDRLIKITLNGIYGPMEVNGKEYPGQVPMTPFQGMLNDEEIAAVLTYVRNAFGNKAAPISPDKVKAVRESTKNKTGFYSPEELLKQHPMEK